MIKGCLLFLGIPLVLLLGLLAFLGLAVEEDSGSMVEPAYPDEPVISTAIVVTVAPPLTSTPTINSNQMTATAFLEAFTATASAAE